jgi:hypothetical protein
MMVSMGYKVDKDYLDGLLDLFGDFDKVRRSTHLLRSFYSPEHLLCDLFGDFDNALYRLSFTLLCCA